MSFPVDVLKYADVPTLLTVERAYLHYDGGGQDIVIDGVNHVGDIHADTRQMKAMAVEDPKMAKMLADVFAASDIIGVVEISTDGKIGFVSFRGTAKQSEWFDDFDFAPSSMNFGLGTTKVHSGFKKVYELSRPSMVGLLGVLAGVEKVIVSGHSLGSGVATLCALDLKGHKMFKVVDCWTFASPRVFWGSTKLFDRNIDSSLRVENPVDIVSHLPPVFFGYRHVTGGLRLHAEFKNAHDLMATYRPGLERIIAESGKALQPIQTLGSEEDAIAKVALEA